MTTIRTQLGYAHVQDLKAACGDDWQAFLQKNKGAGYVAAGPHLSEFNVPCCLVYAWFGARCSWDESQKAIVIYADALPSSSLSSSPDAP